MKSNCLLGGNKTINI